MGRMLDKEKTNTFDVKGLGGDLIAEAAKAMLRLRSGYSFIPHLFF